MMKNSFHKNCNQAFTLIEVILIVATLTLLVAVFLPALARQQLKKKQIACVNNLMQVGLSFRIWDSNGDRYSMAMSTNEGGTMEYLETSEMFRHFQTLSNELGSPKVLVCPSDKERGAAANFQSLSNSNISYFVGADASENLPQSILSGDRNVTNGLTPKNGILVLLKNQTVGWTKEIHNRQGNVALGDGSVQQCDSARLQNEIVAHSDLATNRIALP
ncbi:MAG: type II secretion system protein [Verrucomicrobiota bacterium]